jgi:hypothetical protein
LARSVGFDPTVQCLSLPLDALRAMKPLIAQYGAEKVKEMVDLLG